MKKNVSIYTLCPLCFMRTDNRCRCCYCDQAISVNESARLATGYTKKHGYLIKTYVTDTPGYTHINIAIHERETGGLVALGYMYIEDIDSYRHRIENMFNGYIWHLVQKYEKSIGKDTSNEGKEEQSGKDKKLQEANKEATVWFL